MSQSNQSASERRWPLEFWITFPLHWDLVSETRRYIGTLLEKAVDVEAVSNGIGLAVHELLENAVKYGAGDMAILGVKVSGTETVIDTTVSVSTRVAETDAQEVRDIFQEMAQAADAASYYAKLLEAHARQRPAYGLGLARIWAEGDMTLSCSIEGEDLTVNARGSFEAEVQP